VRVPNSLDKHPFFRREIGGGGGNRRSGSESPCVTLDGLAWAYLLSIALERTSRRDPSQPCAALRGTGTCPNLSDEASDEGNLLQIDHVEDRTRPRSRFR